MDISNKRLSSRQMMWVVGILAGILIIGGAFWWIRASRIVSTDDARVKGTIASISAKSSGRIEQVMVNAGDSVKKGQILLILEKDEIEAQVERAKATVAGAEAKLKLLQSGNRNQEIGKSDAEYMKAVVNMENAKRDLDRDSRLYEQGALSARNRDITETNYQVAVAQVRAAGEERSLMVEGSRAEDIQIAEAQLKEAKANLKTLEIQLKDRAVRSPIDGVVALKSIEMGEIVAAGQPLFKIADLDDVWVSANIEENYVGRIQVGQSVEFTIDAYPGKKFTGKVIEVNPAANSQLSLLPSENSSGNFTKVTQRLPIKIKADNTGEHVLKPGMSAVVDIYTR